MEPGAIDLLACATTLPDLLVSRFASTVHGELSELSPLEIVSTQGVCCAGVSALNYAASQIELGKKKTAIAVASELPSRLFKNTKFEAKTSVQAGTSLLFDTEFFYPARYMMLTAVENSNKSMISQISHFYEVPEVSPLESIKPEHPKSPQAYFLRELVWIWLTSARLLGIATGIM
ncbi:hypothetical protein QUA27_20765 [Microcoleus sp. Pol14C6]|uniref:hypothetical protein n=1 Tax=unclassified Microcoleus TaxID=2642155 RepID=UPI002FD4CE93